MGSGALPILRTPLILLAAADLAVLAFHLRPWSQIPSLPGNGATGIDPLVCLVAYIGLFLWLGGSRAQEARRALGAATLLGFIAGLALVAQIAIGARLPFPQAGPLETRFLSFTIAAILCGIAGLRGARAVGNVALGLLCGLWSAMVSCLMACAAVLAEMGRVAAAPISSDPWKQYEGLAVGNQAMQSLVHSLDMARAYLIIGPLVGASVGLIFARIAPPRKS